MGYLSIYKDKTVHILMFQNPT